MLLEKLLNETDQLLGLQLFKEIHSQVNEVVVYNGILCRALVVLCASEGEISLAQQLVKKGFSIGAYPRNTSVSILKIVLFEKIKIVCV